MQVEYIHNSTVKVDDGETSILCDPWIADGAYYGSWAQYPPIEQEPEDFNDVDYIYISHIHPDHCHIPTLERMDKDIPVLVHDFKWDYLVNNIERLGFDTHELPHDERFHLGGDTYIDILASDDCDPEVCGAFFGCPWYAEDASSERTNGSTQIDTLAVIDDGESTVVNVNDCRWPLTQQAAFRVAEEYDSVDFLMANYRPAHGYPQCRFDYSPAQKKQISAQREQNLMESSLEFAKVLEPDYYMPFAGSYAIAGSNHDVNRYMPNTRKIEAKRFFEQSDVGGEVVLLNSGDHFDLVTGEQSSQYVPISEIERAEHIETELAGREYTYEQDEMPELSDFEPKVPDAYEHFEAKRTDIGYSSDTLIYLQLTDDQYLRVSADGSGYEYVDSPEADDRPEKRITIKTDPRLMYRILRGPKYAHFNNAVIGSHLRWAIEPDEYDRSLFYCLNFFHC